MAVLGGIVRQTPLSAVTYPRDLQSKACELSVRATQNSMPDLKVELEGTPRRGAHWQGLRRPPGTCSLSKV
jgi:hypothetical protein